MGEHDGQRPPAGWFDDPDAPGRQRWWDGTSWTEHRRDASASAPPHGTAPTSVQPGASPSWATGSAATEPRVNALAIGSLVASLVWMGGLSSVAAIVLGVLAKQQIAASGGRERGEGMATAGIVLGIVGVALPLLALVGGALFLLPFRVG